MKRRSILTLLATLPITSACGETRGPRRPVGEHDSSTHGPGGEAATRGDHTSTLIADVPHVRQKPDFCGEAVVAAYLEKLGKPYDQDDVFAMSGMDPSRGMGATTRELKRALEHIGFDPGPVWHHVNANQAGVELGELFSEMHADLLKGVPSIVCTHYDDRPHSTEHFRLVLGYDADTDEVVYHEPAEDHGAYRRMKRAHMLALWPLKYEPAKWTVIRMRLAPDKLVDPPVIEGHTPADYAQHVRKLKARLGEGFTVLVEKPFVVAGDDAPDVVKKRALGTVRWAVQQLKTAYFKKDPAQILDVYLFKNKRSYRANAKRLFGEIPDTPYGYYSSDDRALVMNISTGGGTLVHEIVHPFIEANFPNCPSWFNEGLGSLYEQSAERSGKIVGLTNWRLAGLQEAIKDGVVPTFKTLTHTSRNAFYNRDPGTNYSQSRYLLYYMQEKGVLNRYYHAFISAQASDPTGYDTLRAVLGESDMLDFKKRWEAYVMKLRFR